MSQENFDRYDLDPPTGDNVREDFSNAIYNIDPTATPFMTGCAKGSAKNTVFSWQTDTLDTVDPTNAAIDGADAGNDSSSAAVRVQNTQQIKRAHNTHGAHNICDTFRRNSGHAFQ